MAHSTGHEDTFPTAFRNAGWLLLVLQAVGVALAELSLRTNLLDLAASISFGIGTWLCPSWTVGAGVAIALSLARGKRPSPVEWVQFLAIGLDATYCAAKWWAFFGAS